MASQQDFVLMGMLRGMFWQGYLTCQGKDTNDPDVQEELQQLVRQDLENPVILQAIIEEMPNLQQQLASASEEEIGEFDEEVLEN